MDIQSGPSDSQFPNSTHNYVQAFTCTPEASLVQPQTNYTLWCLEHQLQ
jgi:hypothetical protein